MNADEEGLAHRAGRAVTRSAAWTLVNAATRRSAAQTTEALRIRDLARQVGQRYRNVTLPQRAGHLFEVMHEAGFNRDAIAQGSRVRASTTEWVTGGSQNAPADLHVRDEGGRLLAAAQAKLLSRTSATASGIAREGYAGQQRLVAEDKAAPVRDLLDRRLRMTPEGLRYGDYVDARAHVTDTLQAVTEDGKRVTSRPVPTGEAHRAARNPSRWGDRQATAAASREVGSAVAAGAAAGAVLAGVVEAAKQAARVRAGETSAAAAAATAAGAAAMGATRSAAAAGLHQAVAIAVRAGTLPEFLGRGSTPAAVAAAVADVTDAGLAFAGGEIDAAELAARCCEAALRVTLVGACSGLAQTVIPVPLVAGLVGGLVGQVAATLIAQGLRAAVSTLSRHAVEPDPERADRIAALEDETAEALTTALLLAEAEDALATGLEARVSSEVGPLADKALTAVTAEDPDVALGRLIDVTQRLDGQPMFVTVEEFSAWMADTTTSLSLDPNWR